MILPGKQVKICFWTGFLLLLLISGIFPAQAAYGHSSNSINGVDTAALPTLISPIGAVTNNVPVYTWTAVKGASVYQIQVRQGSTWIHDVVLYYACAGTICKFLPDKTLSNQTYYWRVRAKTGSIWNPYTEFTSFSVNADFVSYFDSSSKGWTPVTGSWSIYNAEYYKCPGILNKISSIVHESRYPRLHYTVAMWRQNDRYGTNRIIFRGKIKPLSPSYSWFEGYVFQYTNSGYYSVFKTTAGKTTQLIGWTTSSLIHQTDENTLQVIADGPNMFFYINYVLVATGTDATFTDGQIGVGMYEQVDGAPLLVDFARVKTKFTTPTLDGTENVPTFQPKEVAAEVMDHPYLQCFCL